MKKKGMILLKMECTMLFQSNPYMVESAEGVSRRLEAPLEEIQPMMEQLLEQGIVERVDEGETPLYRYSEPVIITDPEKKDVYKQT
jgi:hypothetical protein